MFVIDTAKLALTLENINSCISKVGIGIYLKILDLFAVFKFVRCRVQVNFLLECSYLLKYNITA